MAFDVHENRAENYKLPYRFIMHMHVEKQTFEGEFCVHSVCGFCFNRDFVIK